MNISKHLSKNEYQTLNMRKEIVPLDILRYHINREIQVEHSGDFTSKNISWVRVVVIRSQGVRDTSKGHVNNQIARTEFTNDRVLPWLNSSPHLKVQCVIYTL